MRRYADPVEVRRGPVGSTPADDAGSAEGPQQFLWRGRLWKVRAVLAHWVETGPWWQSSGRPQRVPLGDLLTERELWRVEAGRPRPAATIPDADTEAGVSGVFDLSFDWADGCWTLVGCTD